MSHTGDYIDGVPVKISEKYKPPKRVELNFNIVENINRALNATEDVTYDFQLENVVLEKLNELKKAKETLEIEKKHRLQLYEEAKQKKLDEIAAEEKFQQLNVSEVSYPSTEDISDVAFNDNIEPSAPVLTIEEMQLNYQQESPSNILQPIQIPSNPYPTNLLDDPDPLQKYKMINNPKLVSHLHSKNVDKLSVADFENDTSSPFDNVELKTINDMELLAQVLEKQRIQYYQMNGMGNSSFPANSYMLNNENCDNVNNMYYTPQNVYTDTNYYNLQGVQNMNNLQQPMCNEYMTNYMPMTTSNINLHCNSTVSVPHNVLEQNYSNCVPYNVPYYFNYEQPTTSYIPEFDPTLDINNTPTVKSRSRCVGDILKELDIELDKAKSHNEEIIARLSKKENKTVSVDKKEDLPNPLNELNSEQQSVCMRIGGMGFPLSRVAKLCKIIGTDDKKIIECLLAVDELMEFGFQESSVIRELVLNKFDSNKTLDALAPP